MSDERLRQQRRAASQGDELALARLGIELPTTPDGAFLDVHEGLRIQLPPGVDPEKASIAGATQYDTHELCERKWWFLWGVKMPKVQPDFFTFGTVLHAANERYLLADDLGRDASGKPYELWPAGWDKDITFAEANVIKTLVQQGIDKGVVTRRKGRAVEHAFVESIGTHRDRPMFISGKIDLMFVEDAEVQDHKTTKTMKYAKSPAALAKAIQGKTYGKVLLDERTKRGLPVVDQVKFRHNVYCKDPEDLRVKVVETWLSREAIEDQHEANVAASINMVNLKTTFTSPNDWFRIPPPKKPASACMAYGGCAFTSICSGRERGDEYKTRIEAHLERINPTQPKKEDHTTMSFSDTLKHQKQNAVNGDVPDGGATTLAGPADTDKFAVIIGGNSAWKTGAEIRALLVKGELTLQSKAMPKGQTKWSTVAACGFVMPEPEAPLPPADDEPPAPEGEGDVVDETPQQPAQQQASAPTFKVAGPAPWANKACPACSTGPNPGFTTKGNPCRICDDLQVTAKGPRDCDYDLSSVDGTITWKQKAPAAPVAPPPAAPPPADKPKRQKKADEAPPAGNAPAGDAPPVTKGPGRPRVTFKLYINCIPVGRDVVDLGSVLNTYGAKIAEKNKAASYYDLEVFGRRDTLSSYGAEIAAALTEKQAHVTVSCNSAASDIKTLLDSIRGYASEVVVGA